MELGGEFFLDLTQLNTTAHSILQSLQAQPHHLFDSGRSALSFAAQALSDGPVLLPEYICASVIRAFEPREIRFYRLSPSLDIDCEDLLSKLDGSVSAVFLMHYFGSLQSAEALDLLRTAKEKYGFTVIEDTTHSFFTTRQTIGDLCVASLRKWFALPGGGVVYGPQFSLLESYPLPPAKTDNTRAYGMIEKALFLQEKLDCNTEYLQLFQETEEALDRQRERFTISDFSRFLLSTVDGDLLAAQRRANYARLCEALAPLGFVPVCTLPEGGCPLTLPILVEDRDEFRRYLMQHNIYCAVHWPFDGTQPENRPLAQYMAAHMISLPIDQRYDAEQIDYLIQTIQAYKEQHR